MAFYIYVEGFFQRKKEKVFLLSDSLLKVGYKDSISQELPSSPY